MVDRRRTVVVTGSARGLGLGIVRRFAAGGDRVVIADIDREEGKSVVDRLLVDGVDATFVRLDVRVQSEHVAVVEKLLKAFGSIDVWINNAAVVRRGSAEDLGRTDWDETLGVILSGAFYGSQAAGRAMLAQGAGVIINIGSADAYHPVEGRVANTVANGGLIKLTEALGIEWAARGVRVAAVAPGVILQEGGEHAASSLYEVERRTPMGRPGEIDEIAEVVAFLASDDASYIVGETLRVDGGWTAYQLF